jgi:hypothetical protein
MRFSKLISAHKNQDHILLQVIFHHHSPILPMPDSQKPGGSIGSYTFWEFYLVKNHKIVNNSTTTETREK